MGDDIECIDLAFSDSDDQEGESVAPKKRAVRKRKSGRKYMDSDGRDDDDDSLPSDSDGSDDEFVPDSRVGATTRPPARRVRQRRVASSASVDMADGANTLDHASSLRSRIRQVLHADEGGGDEDDSLMDNGKSSGHSHAAPVTTTFFSNRGKPVPAAVATAYLKSLQAATQKRSFSLSKIPPHQVIPTGRTIKPMRAWKGHWPALREFMQNTIDHLGLMDGKTGRRRSVVDLHVTKGGHDGTLATFQFSCGEEDICTIVASQDELTIKQRYTFPIASRALDTGVPDTTKGVTSSNQAGGFGDGFKTAAVALLASAKEFKSMKWYFNAGGENIVWTFEGLTRQSIGTFAKCQVLQVNIDRVDFQDPEVSNTKENVRNASLPRKGGGKATIAGRDYVMKQVIKVKGVGKSFIEQAVPRLAVFWDVDDASVLHTAGNGGDFVGSTLDMPSLFCGALGSGLKPESGIYVRGIWVRTAKIANTVSCFYGNRLQVTGRDRNDVDEDELVDAFVYIFKKCGNLSYLKQLLEPLRGKQTGNDDLSASAKHGKRSTRGSAGSGGSWLLQSPRFHNRVIEQQKDFILHSVLGIPRGAIFVSNNTTKSNDPFIKWAAEFLKSHDAPLVPIERGANKHLFEEVSEIELTERCVRILKGSLREGGAKKLDSAFKKLLTFMGLGRAKVFFSTEISTAFCFDRNIFVPEAALTRELVVRVLNVCHSNLEGASDDSYSCLMQAIFETLPAGSARQLEIADLTEAVARAKAVQKETRDFLTNKSSAKEAALSCNSSKRKSQDDLTVKNLTGSGEVEDLTEQDTSLVRASRENGITRGGGAQVPATAADLMEQIRRANQKGKGKKKGGCCESDLPPIIPQTEFEGDNAGDDTCLRPASSLEDVPVDASLGGGSMFCDARSASEIQNGTWSARLRSDVSALREHLNSANDLVRGSIPSLGQLLQRVKAGFDADNDDYEAFCNGTHIVVNLHAFKPKLLAAAKNPRALIHDFVVVVTHELAHFLEPTAGHGPVWRDTHMKMLVEVMQHLEAVST